MRIMKSLTGQRKFGCTKQELQAAVDKVGVSAAAVEKELTGR
jgi:hypothetical protein